MNEYDCAKVTFFFVKQSNLFGDVPYSEFSQSVTPAYDSQENILHGLLRNLEQAEGGLAAANGAIEGDLLFDGDISKWRKYARSLRLRIALEIADRDVATAKTVISALYSDRTSLRLLPEDLSLPMPRCFIIKLWLPRSNSTE